MGLAIYLLFTVSWFLHLPARLPFLGMIRFDFVLIIILLGLSLVGMKGRRPLEDSDQRPVRYIWFLILYILVTIPIVQWPGSVVRAGIPEFMKAFVFFIFTMCFVRTTRDLKALMTVFLGCQVFRVLEPVYLHWTEGYWGSRAAMSGWEAMDRLSGAPVDVINPNGLAFICLTVLPFLYYYAGASKKMRLFLVPVVLLALYALLLTGSRSGFITLLVVFGAIVLQAGKKTAKLYLPMLFIALFFFGYTLLGENFRDRYASILDGSARNAVTFDERIQGIKDDLQVALNRPLFGHGLGTSLEANFNIRGGTHRSHNLYAEIAQELGIFGLIIFLLYILSLFRLVRSLRGIPLSEEEEFLTRTNKGLEVWFYMNLVFSLASYGLSGYQWYLFGALILKARELSLAHRQKEVVRAKEPAGAFIKPIREAFAPEPN